MELWASGFNAWNQLQFDGSRVAEPRDLKEFECLLRDTHIGILRTTLSAVLGRSLALLMPFYWNRSLHSSWSAFNSFL